MERLCRHHELIFNSIHEAVYVISWQGNIVQLNAPAAQLAECETKDLTGRPLRNVLLTSPDSTPPPPWMDDPIFHAIRSGQSSQGQGWILRSTGGILPIRFSLTPVRDSEKVVGAVLTATESV
jgi:PAS domain S-box-containing protein